MQNFREKKVEPLGASLTKYFDSHQREWAKKSAVAEGWERVVPVSLQGRCRAGDFSDGVLVVEAQPGPVMQELSQLRSSLLRKLRRQRQCGDVTRIQLKPKAVKQDDHDESEY